MRHKEKPKTKNQIAAITKNGAAVKPTDCMYSKKQELDGERKGV